LSEVGIKCKEKKKQQELYVRIPCQNDCFSLELGVELCWQTWLEPWLDLAQWVK